MPAPCQDGVPGRRERHAALLIEQHRRRVVLSRSRRSLGVVAPPRPRSGPRRCGRRPRRDGTPDRGGSGTEPTWRWRRSLPGCRASPGTRSPEGDCLASWEGPEFDMTGKNQPRRPGRHRVLGRLDASGCLLLVEVDRLPRARSHQARSSAPNGPDVRPGTLRPRRADVIEGGVAGRATSRAASPPSPVVVAVSEIAEAQRRTARERLIVHDREVRISRRAQAFSAVKNTQFPLAFWEKTLFVIWTGPNVVPTSV